MNVELLNHRTLADLGVPHPTPVHIRSCIFDALTKQMAERKEYVPMWVTDAIREGIRTACAEHDAEAV